MEEKPQILLLEDETTVTDNLAFFLERSGFSVLVAPNGEEALKIIGEVKLAFLVWTF
jgi:DNA-binding response OmpR family regulator